VRTYITVVAGVGRMGRRRFLVWSLVGAALWVVSITLLGYFLGRTVPALGDNIDLVIVVILMFSVIPVAYEWWRHRRTSSPEADDNDADGVPDRNISGLESGPAEG
jgi:membrane-associated protein